MWQSSLVFQQLRTWTGDHTELIEDSSFWLSHRAGGSVHLPLPHSLVIYVTVIWSDIPIQLLVVALNMLQVYKYTGKAISQNVRLLGCEYKACKKLIIVVVASDMLHTLFSFHFRGPTAKLVHTSTQWHTLQDSLLSDNWWIEAGKGLGSCSWVTMTMALRGFIQQLDRLWNVHCSFGQPFANNCFVLLVK
jgi:hypothetical protein